MIRVTLNGKPRDVPGGNVIELLDHLGLKASWTLVELNREPLARETYRTTTLQEGDVLEVVRAVAGG